LTRLLEPLRCAPLLLLPGCAASLRGGGETKLLRGDATIEGQGTAAIGGAGDDAGSGAFLPVATLTGGVLPKTGDATGSFEIGGEYARAVASRVSLRAGPRVAGVWGARSGSYMALRAGAFFAPSPAYLDDWYPVLGVEVLGGPALGGDLAGTVVAGAALSIGYEWYGSFHVPSGRPVRRDGALVVAEVASTTAWRENAEPDRRALSRGARVAIGRSWLADARTEHASIAAFAKLSLELLACGAPPDLVAGAHRAALDEVRHAKLCFSLASHYLDEPVDPGAMPRIDAERASLESLAIEALVDGAFGEGVAATLAGARRRAARDEHVRRVLGIVAREERRHAELGWEIVTWALREARVPIGEALRATWADVGARRLRANEEPAGDFSAHGIPTVRQVHAATLRVRRRVEQRLSALLGSA
jgi:hypothetical protein